jgi:hypothetical protein
MFTEYAEFDEQMNDNDDKELKPLVQPTSFHSNHAINRLLDPFENAANVYNNYQLVSISPSGSDPDIFIEGKSFSSKRSLSPIISD